MAITQQSVFICDAVKATTSFQPKIELSCDATPLHPILLFFFYIKYIFFSLRRTSTLRLFLCSGLFFDDFMTHRPMRWVIKVAHLQCYEHSYHDPARQREGKTTRWDVDREGGREGGGRENTRYPPISAWLHRPPQIDLLIAD